MEQVIPVPTLHLFPVLDKLLLELLASLSPQDWHKPTVAKIWDVKDVAAHLLDGNIRAISAHQNYQTNEPQSQINSYRDLVDYLNNFNNTWVKAMRRVSPQVLMNQLAATGPLYIQYLNSLDLFAPAMYPVAWAGEEVSPNWFHIAREYTEKWHHQQQIRDAVSKPGLITPELFYPLIDTFMHALPHSYKNIPANIGAVIKITVSGEAGGDWYLKKTADKWMLSKTSANETVAASVVIPQDTAWRFFTKATPSYTAFETSTISGDACLASHIFNTLAVMA